MNQSKLDLQPTIEYRTIKLTQGLVTKIDASDYESLSKHKWHAHWNPRTRSHYAARQTYWIDSNGKKRQRKSLMHREIMQAPNGIQVDHIYHDTLDNRRSQLRLATQTQNQANVSIRRNNKTGFSGVFCRMDSTGRLRYAACIRDGKGRQNGKLLCLGTYDTPEKASEVREAKARELRGEFYAPPTKR